MEKRNASLDRCELVDVLRSVLSKKVRNRNQSQLAIDID